MKNSTSYWTIATWLVIPLLSAILWLSQVNVAVAQTNAVNAQQQAISRLDQFTNQVSNMRSVVGKSLGPYPIYTRCTWCSEKEWWGLGLCTRETTETWDTKVDFTWTRQRLTNTLDKSQRYASTFSNSYQPTQNWISELPKFSTKFDTAANVVLTVQQEIKAGIGPNFQQREVVTQALQDLSNDLNRSAFLLQNGTSALASFLQNQSAYREEIQRGINGADQSAQQALTNLENQSKTHHCQDGLNEKYAGIRADFSRSLQEISDAFQQLGGSSREAEKSLALLLGTVVNSQTDLNTVLELVQAASNEKLGSFLERLHLSQAKEQWKNMADYAASNLSN
jgi:uncharacterized coiled-coil DUF342 family protein